MATSGKQEHDRETDSEDEGETKKHRQYNHLFKPSYCKDYPFVTSLMKGKHFAFCKVCKTDFSVSHSGSFDIGKHAKGKRYRPKENAVTAGSSSTARFFTSKSDEKAHADSNLQLSIKRSDHLKH